MEKMAIPAARFSHVHMDIVGPLPPPRAGHTHFLTMIDRSTRWLKAVLLRETTVEAVLDTLVFTWVAHFGVPSITLWVGWCWDYGVQHITTTAFPQANGIVERLHCQMKDALHARGGPAAWADHLPWVMLGIRASPKEESGTSADEAALGHVLAVQGQLLPASGHARATGGHPSGQVDLR